MNAIADSVLSSICHRAGEHSDVLPLCERCSAVYAGILVGVVFEVLLQGAGRGRPGRAAVVMASAALAVMAVVGFGGIYGLFQPPESVKVFTALWFGSAIAFFAATALAKGAGRKVEPFSVRLAMLAGMVVLALLVAVDSPWALPALGAMAVPGLCTGLLLVNFAVAFSVLGAAGRRLRMVGSVLLVPVLAAVELLLFRFWRTAL